MLRLRQISFIATPTPQLQLEFQQQPDPANDAASLQQWLQQFAAISRLQLEISMDLLLIRFYFAEQPFYLHLEHYTEACWIDTDSATTDMLLSELHSLLAQDLV